MKLEVKSFRTKVARRIFTLFIICAILPISTLALVSFGHVKRQLTEQSHRRLRQESKSMAVSIYERLFIIRSEMRVVASNFRSSFENAIRIQPGVLPENLIGRFSGLAHITNKGYTPLLGEIKDPPELTPAEKRHIFSDEALLRIKVTQDSMPPIFMCVALDPEHPERGILLGKINNSYLWEAADRRPPLTELCVLDRSHNILFSFPSGPASVPKQYISEISGSHSGRFEWRSEDNEYIACYSSIFLTPNFFSPPWIIVLSESTDNVLAPMANFNKSFPVLIILSLGMVFFLSMILIRKNMGPIEILREATRAIGKGTFGHKVMIKSGDEFETLGSAFNEMSKKLEEGQTMLVRAAKMSTVGQMAAGVMHEIKQPLTAIHGLLQIALLEESSGVKKERLETTLKAVERLNNILGRFKSFSYMSEETMDSLSIIETVDQVCRLLEHEFILRQIQCTIDNEENLPPVLGDGQGLEQVLSNLLINAMHALESKRYGQRIINIKTYSYEDKVFLEIEDNGGGILKEIQDRIFEPFFTTKEQEEGTGLGMTIIESILHKHQASIEVKSEVRVGTIITIAFPALSQKEIS